ncbi:hypothetical protein BS78_04G253900 [Paspalum vaginatum]|nr:hypothetical protein BS78_04G253900 [Paspalum vaginatum]
MAPPPSTTFLPRPAPVKVYSRRGVRGTTSPAAPPTSTPTVAVSRRRQKMNHSQGSEQEPGPDLSTPAKSFIAEISLAVDGILQKPAAPRRRVKHLPPDFTLRRSERLKNKQGKPSSAKLQTQRDLMQQLDLVEANATIGDQELQGYCSLFDQPLSQSHVAALAALFGWLPPPPWDAPGEVAIFLDAVIEEM